MTRNTKALAMVAFVSLLFFLGRGAAAPQSDSFRFAILGDRTGEAGPGVYEQVWQEAAAENPAFVVTTGDTIEGLHDVTAQTEWLGIERILQPYKRFPLYLTPGNHDIWSAMSERLFREHAGMTPGVSFDRYSHYSFDRGPAHFTILDNSRSDELSATEMTFLEADLKAHAAQPVKFIISHRPSWLIQAALRNPNFPLHQLAKHYGVQYVIAGHLHQMLRFEVEGVTYLSMPSAGGNLRASEKYADGWFFGHALITLRGTNIDFQIEELKPPLGQGRTTKSWDWGMLGLLEGRAR